MPETPRGNLRDATAEDNAALKRKEYRHNYYEKHKERLKKYSRDYTLTHREQVSAYKKQYHIDNRERIIAKTKKYYEANKEHRSNYRKKWQQNNRDKCREYSRVDREKLRQATFESYGGPVCACCSETTIQFLTIDHIDGGGNVHRKTTGTRGGNAFYRWLKKNGYPPGFRVLCYNCNMARGARGYCPHEIPPITIQPL